MQFLFNWLNWSKGYSFVQLNSGLFFTGVTKMLNRTIKFLFLQTFFFLEKRRKTIQYMYYSLKLFLCFYREKIRRHIFCKTANH